jgi:tetratricopeptide (TPR) repeat protein
MYEGIEDIYNLLRDKRLKEALIQLQALAPQAGMWNLQARIEQTATAYSYMLQYAAQGMEDPTRADFYRKTLRTAYELTDELHTALKAKKTNGAYYDCIRTLALKPARTYAELTLMLETYAEDSATANLIYHDIKKRKEEMKKTTQRHEDTLNELFERTWATPHWSETEAREATNILKSLLVPANDLAVLVSAATLSQLRMFDARKLDFLFEAYRHPDLQVSQRAIVGIILTFEKYEFRISLYPEIEARISLLTEDSSFQNNLYTIQMQLLITRETTKIDKRMREEIIPEMIKNTKHLNNPNLRLDEVEDPMELNPEWEAWMDKSGLEDKIREMGEWQMAGADVYMSSFAQLKHYPFFHQMSNWFRPFDVHHPALESICHELEKVRISPLHLIAHSPYFCNSDKYSFALSISSLTKAMQEASIRQMEQQAEAEKGSLDKMRNLIEMKPQAKDISRQYLQDLYRFFKLWRNHNEEEDIFHWPFALWKNHWLKKAIFADTEQMKQMADYLLQKEYFLDADEVYYRLLELSEPTAEIHQKMGYILQKQEMYEVAIRHYKQADIMQPENLWTLKHLAQCSRLNEEYEVALNYYRDAEKIAPNDLTITNQIAQCLVRKRQYDEALRYFHKVEYLGKHPERARRAIAWCLFCCRRYDEALGYYQPITNSPEVRTQDWMNIAHVYLAKGATAEALKCYQKAHQGEKSHTAFVKKIEDDREELKRHGLTDEDIDIMLDLLV